MVIKNLTEKKDWTSNENDVFKAFITPELAKLMLACKLPFDRRETVANTEKIMKDLKSEEYYSDVCGNQIGFDKDGNLQNGKHRLQSCINTGIGFWSKIEVGCSHAEKVDCGKQRTMKERLGYYGFTKQEVDDYSSTVKCVLQIRNGFAPTNNGIKMDFPEQSYIDFLESNMENLEKVGKIYSEISNKGRQQYFSYKNKFEKCVIMGYMYHLIYDKGFSETMVKTYFSGIRSLDTQKNVHIERARKKFLANTTKPRSETYTPKVVHNFIVDYWEDYANDKTGQKHVKQHYTNSDEVKKFESCAL